MPAVQEITNHSKASDLTKNQGLTHKKGSDLANTSAQNL